MKQRVFFLLLLAVCFAGCGSAEPRKARETQTFEDTRGHFIEQSLHAEDVMQRVERRNRVTEKDPSWISWAYGGLSIQKVNEIPAERYHDYVRFVENSSVYIFVHPSYYLFFHAKKPPASRNGGDLSDSIVDLFLQGTYADPVLRLEQEQQRNEKNFIEYLSTDNKLVILVLPRNYGKAGNYTYAAGIDEYARYLNEIANGSPSILYMESESSSSGRLLPEDLIPLLSLMESLGIKSVMIGGGYVGRCQKEFYAYLSSYALGGKYSIVPELSTFSPDDVSKSASKFFDGDRIDIRACSEFVIAKSPDTTNIQHLSPHYFDTVLKISAAHNREEQDRPFDHMRKDDRPATQPAAGANQPEDERNFCYEKGETHDQGSH